MTSYKPDQEIVLEKNPNYWGEATNVDKYIIKIQPDANTQMMTLSSGCLLYTSCAAHRRTAFLYGYYFAGNTRMNRSAHRSIDIADPLTDFDQVALFYQGLTGPSDVL